MATPIIKLDPNNRFGDFIDSTGKACQVQLDGTGKVPVVASVSATVSDGLKVKIEDSTGANILDIDSNGVASVKSAKDSTRAQAIGEYASAQTDTSLIADPGVGKTIVIDSLIISNGATAGYILLEADTTGTPTPITGKIYLGVNSGAVIMGNIIGITHKNIGVLSNTCTTHSVTACYHVE